MSLQDPPIDWPAVSIGGVSYTLPWSYRVTYRASKQGLDLTKLGRPVESFASHMDLFAIVVASEFEKRGEHAPTGEEWAERLDSLEQFKEIAVALHRSYQMSLKPQPAEVPTPQKAATGALPN